ncbi:MAG: RES domain-containing protein [Gammaproteobacteria bacterium]|nr:RES domain-containing protein [Gammaproteobacteria bacterium]
MIQTDCTPLHGYHRVGRLLLPVKGTPKGTPFFRIYNRADGDWQPAPADWRFGRVDPPLGFRDEYSVLYGGDCQLTAEFEFRIMRTVHDGTREVVERSFQPDRQPRLVCHVTRRPLLFVDCDSPMVEALLEGIDHGTVDRRDPWQRLALRIYRAVTEASHELVAPIVGMTYRSRHRGCEGAVLAVFDRYRALALRRGISRILA